MHSQSNFVFTLNRLHFLTLSSVSASIALSLFCLHSRDQQKWELSYMGWWFTDSSYLMVSFHGVGHLNRSKFRNEGNGY